VFEVEEKQHKNLGIFWVVLGQFFFSILIMFHLSCFFILFVANVGVMS
jgi:hypothetical protein